MTIIINTAPRLWDMAEIFQKAIPNWKTRTAGGQFLTKKKFVLFINRVPAPIIQDNSRPFPVNTSKPQIHNL